MRARSAISMRSNSILLICQRISRYIHFKCHTFWEKFFPFDFYFANSTWVVGTLSTRAQSQPASRERPAPHGPPRTKTRRMNQQRCQTIYVSDESKRLEERFLFRVTWNLSSFLTAEHLVFLMTLFICF